MNHANDESQPLELILARNLVSIISLAAVLVDADGRIVFYNDAAAQLVGEPFEEIGTMTCDEWNARYGPVDEHGAALAADALPLASRRARGARLLGAFESAPSTRCSRSRPERCHCSGPPDIEVRWSSSGSPASVPGGRRALSENGTSLCYLPDHEPALGQDLAAAPVSWISGHALAAGASLLIHDGQYSEDEYPAHRGRGHSSVNDALVFGRRCGVQRLLLFHHDPWHDDASFALWSGGVGALDRARRRRPARARP